MATLEDFTGAFHRHFSRNSNSNLAKGIDEKRDELPDPSLEHARQTRSEALNLAKQAAALRKVHWSDFEASLDLDLATLMLEAEIHSVTYEFNGRTALQQTPSAGSDIGSGIFLLLTCDPRPEADRLDDILHRLRQVPEFLRSMLARLDTPVQRWVNIDDEKVRGLSSLLSTVEALAERVDWSGTLELQSAIQTAGAALTDYRRALSSMPTTHRFAIGAEATERIVALRGIEQSPSELHAMARNFLEETASQIDALRGRLVSKYGLASTTSADELHTFLNSHYRLEVGGNFSLVIDRYRAELEGIVSFIRERNLFPIFDDQRVRLLQTPEFMTPSIPAGAMMSPPSFRSGTRESLVYLTLSEELLDEHTSLTIPSMMIHEGIPGHHLQLATASLHSSIFRRHIEAMDQAEGWTTFLEDYMLDVGYASALTDEIRFCAKRDISRIGARVAIDLFFMTGDASYLEVGVEHRKQSTDPFIAAGALLQAVTGFVRERVEAELNWYSQERGYPLCYLTGNRLVWRLRRDMKRGSDEEALDVDRRFFRAYLEAGNMPLAHMRRWFEAKGLVDTESS